MKNKKSKEELKEEIDQNIKDAEELAKTHKEEEPEEETKPVEEDVKEEEAKKEEKIVEETPEETKEEEPEVEPSKELYKKKFSASTRENQKQYAKNRVLDKALAEVDDIPEPTEDELKEEYKDWDVMSDFERTLGKETIITRRWREKVKEAQDQAKKIVKWNESVTEFIDDPQTLLDNPSLEGKRDSFIEYATKDENNNVPIKTLVGAFLYEDSTTKKPNKGSMFPVAVGGANTKGEPTSDKISLEEGRILRETDYPKWKELLKAGKIDMNV